MGGAHKALQFQGSSLRRSRGNDSAAQLGLRQELQDDEGRSELFLFSFIFFLFSLPFQGPPGPFGNPGLPGPPGAKVSIISGYGVTKGWGLICGSS